MSSKTRNTSFPHPISNLLYPLFSLIILLGIWNRNSKIYFFFSFPQIPIAAIIHHTLWIFLPLYFLSPPSLSPFLAIYHCLGPHNHSFFISITSLDVSCFWAPGSSLLFLYFPHINSKLIALRIIQHHARLLTLNEE